MRWYFIVFLICISLKISDAEHLFTCLLVLCMPSLEKYIFRPSIHFLIFFPWYWAVWALCLIRSCKIVFQSDYTIFPSNQQSIRITVTLYCCHYWLWSVFCVFFILINIMLSFYWSIPNLQYCASFWCIAKRFSYMYIHIFIFILFSIIGYYEILNMVLCTIQ